MCRHLHHFLGCIYFEFVRTSPYCSNNSREDQYAFNNLKISKLLHHFVYSNSEKFKDPTSDIQTSVFGVSDYLSIILNRSSDFDPEVVTDALYYRTTVVRQRIRVECSIARQSHDRVFPSISCIKYVPTKILCNSIA